MLNKIKINIEIDEGIKFYNLNITGYPDDISNEIPDEIDEYDDFDLLRYIIKDNLELFNNFKRFKMDFQFDLFINNVQSSMSMSELIKLIP
jgi:hypothetical protein